MFFFSLCFCQDKARMVGALSDYVMTRGYCLSISVRSALCLRVCGPPPALLLKRGFTSKPMSKKTEPNQTTGSSPPWQPSPWSCCHLLPASHHVFLNHIRSVWESGPSLTTALLAAVLSVCPWLFTLSPKAPLVLYLYGRRDKHSRRG